MSVQKVIEKDNAITTSKGIDLQQLCCTSAHTARSLHQCIGSQTTTAKHHRDSRRVFSVSDRFSACPRSGLRFGCSWCLSDRSYPGCPSLIEATQVVWARGLADQHRDVILHGQTDL